MFFFFFKQKTAYEMRISDWSSDVCSSDLYQSAGALFWHNVSWVCDDMIPSHAVGDLNIRSGLPHGVDALKLGVAAALAIREALLIRGGPFSDRKSTRLNSSH